MDDFLGGRARVGPKQGREAEGVKGVKVADAQQEKVKQSTQIQNLYNKDTIAKVADANVVKYTGFQNVVEEDERDNRRGGRGGRDNNNQRGGRRQNPKQALKKTEEDFPSL